MDLKTAFLFPDTSVYETSPSSVLVKCAVWRALCKALSLILSPQGSLISIL